MKVVIPSRARSKTIGEHTLALFPDAIVCVEDSEEADYRQVTDNLLLHPPLPSLPAIRNWILDNVPDRMFVMADDDIIHMLSHTGRQARVYRDPAIVMQILDNAGEIADGIGAKYFGFNQSLDPKVYRPQQPFRFNSWVGTLAGYIDRTVRFDEKVRLRDDFDFAMQHLLKHRIVFQDLRFAFVTFERFKSLGGNSINRSAEIQQAEVEYLERKWGQYAKFENRGNTTTSTCRVKRRR